MTREIPSRMLSMFRRDCCLPIWGVISSATSSWGMASGDKLALSTHCWYSFLFFFLRKYFSNVASHRKHCPGFYISYSNSNEQLSQYCLNTISQTLRIRQLEKAGAKYPKQFKKSHNAPREVKLSWCHLDCIFIESPLNFNCQVCVMALLPWLDILGNNVYRLK